MKAVRIARTLLHATLANRDIQGYLRDLTSPRLWTIEGIRRNPTCRVEWEHVTVIGRSASPWRSPDTRTGERSSAFSPWNRMTRYTGGDS